MGKEYKKLTSTGASPAIISDKAMKELHIFKTALLQKNIQLLETVLHEQFIYFDDKNKWATLAWFEKQCEIIVPEHVYEEDAGLSFCMGCAPGVPSLVFHKGWWPHGEDILNQRKSIRINFTDGLISDLTLCYVFCNPGKEHEFIKEN